METPQLAALAALVAGSLAALVGVYAAPLGTRLGLLDFPDLDGGRKRHAVVTPLVGGTALLLALLATTGLALAFDPLLGPVPRVHLLWLAGTVLAMGLIGLADDRFALSPKIRLVLAVAMLLLVVIYAHDFSLPFVRFAGQERLWLLGGIGNAFALLCLVGLLNAVNMADGKNGIVIGLGLIWCIALAFRLPPTMLVPLAGVAAALGVLFVFNLRGKLFLGDGGSYALSTLFGLLAIYAYNHGFATMRADDVAVLFAIPVFDTIRLLAVRAAGGRSPLEGDRDHLHHHLHHAAGWPLGLWVYLALVAIPSAGAIVWPGTGLLWLGIALAGYAATLTAARFGPPRDAAA